MTRKSAQKLKIEQQFVELVKARPVLYVKSYTGYSDAIIRANSWRKIYELIGENDIIDSAESCEKMWSNIWSQYLAFKRKLKGKTGQAGGTRPYFRLESAMKEFDDKLHQESTFSNDPDGSNNEEEDDSHSPKIIQSVTVENETVTVVDFPVTAAPGTQLEATVNGVASPESPRGSPNSARPKPRSHDKKRKDRDFDDELLDVLKSQTKMDEFEAFATGIAIKLRKMDAKKSAEVQFLIHQVVYNAEKGD